MSIESAMLSNHLIVCHPFLLPSIFPSIRVFSSELALCIRWPKYWSFSFSISPSNEYAGLISFRFYILAVQEPLKSLLQHRKFKSINSSEGPKLLHFVRFPEKSLWKSPDLTPPPVNQSEPLASSGNLSQAWERRINQNSTPNPSPEGDQSDLETPVFWIFRGIIPYTTNVTQSSGLLPIAAALVSVGAPARAW